MHESDPRMPATHHPKPPVPGAPVARPVAPTLTTPLCPYCGERVEDGPDAARCASCKGLLDPLSRQATQNAMGPWTLRDDANPFNPGCSYDTVRTLVSRGRIRRDTILRGPTTRQFWMFAANTPGVAVLLGECHACHHAARTDEFLCTSCGAVLSPQTERQSLGLAPVRLLPGAASTPAIAASVLRPAPHAPPITDAPAPTIPPTPAPLRRGIDRSTLAHPEPTDTASPSAALALRRRRDRVQALTIGLTIAVIAVGTLLVLLVVMAVHNADRAEETPTPETTEPAATTAPPEPVQSTPAETSPPPAPPPPPPPAPVAAPTVAGLPIDAGLDAWHDDIAQAAALESTDTLEDLDRAIEILARVRDEASHQTARDSAFPILTARIAALRERSASLHARNG
jgi:hypothetical protein